MLPKLWVGGVEEPSHLSIYVNEPYVALCLKRPRTSALLIDEIITLHNNANKLSSNAEGLNRGFSAGVAGVSIIDVNSGSKLRRMLG